MTLDDWENENLINIMMGLIKRRGLIWVKKRHFLIDPANDIKIVKE